MGKATRDAYGEALVDLGKKNPEIVVLDADLSKSTKTAKFGEVFPDRFFNVGIQEANLCGVASGLASCGKIPFISSFASFLVCKGYDQIRMGIAFPNLNVKVVASHGGITVGEDGASQMSIEDIALMTSFPNFTVTIPSDEYCARALIYAAAAQKGPFYMRTCRPKAPLIHTEKTKFEIGKGLRLRDGKDITLVATGLLVFEALQAAEALAQEGIQASVIEIHTIKPLDEALLVDAAKKTGRIVVAEEHQIWGGLGSAVSALLARKAPVPMAFVAVQDTYAESGLPDELLSAYGLSAPHIAKAAKTLFK
ncbi:MAG: transketolase family protein [Candidatus Omnitrophota bacterium]